MGKPLNIAITFFLVALIAKLVIFTQHLQHSIFDKYLSFLYLLLLLLTVFFGIRNFKQREAPKPTLVRDDMKAGMRTAAFFSILLAIFIFLYYTYFDPFYFKGEIHQRMMMAYNELRASKQHLTNAQIKKKLVQYFLDMKVLYRPSLRAWGTLLIMMFMSFVDAVIISLAFKYMSKKKLV